MNERKELNCLGMTVDETIQMLIRTTNSLYDICDTLQQRVIALEMQTRCSHIYEGGVCVCCNHTTGKFK